MGSGASLQVSGTGEELVARILVHWLHVSDGKHWHRRLCRAAETVANVECYVGSAKLHLRVQVERV